MASNKIFTDSIPSNSILKNQFDKIDFQDSFSFYIQNNKMSINELYIAIFSTAPKWIENLMKLRNKIVLLMGLKTEMKRIENFDFEVGDKVGIFKIYKIEDQEIIAGENDKHLDFRVSIFREITEESKITVSTIVKFNNKFGKFYMTLISPFHKMVVRSLLKKSVKYLKKNDL